MNPTRRLPILFAGLLAASFHVAAAPGIDSTDPLVAVDLNRKAIVADVVESFGGDALLKSRLEALRADRLLAASLASSRTALESILAESHAASEMALRHSRAKVFGDADRDLIYTPLPPCRLIDTRGFGAPIQGGAYAPNERRAYAPAGGCAIPASGVASLVVSYTSQNLTPGSGGYLAIVAPGAPITAIVGVYGTEWISSNTTIPAGSAGQFDVFVNSANAHVVIDVMGYFAPPAVGAVGTAQLADGAVTAAKLAANGCTNGQTLQYNGSAWVCATPSGGGVADGSIGTAKLADGAVTAAKMASNGCGNAQQLQHNGTTWVCVTPGTFAGNVTLATSTASVGNVMKGADQFLHNYGLNNTFLGVKAGNVTTMGGGNTGIGHHALMSIGAGGNNTAVGNFSGENLTGSENTAVGAFALPGATASGNTGVGYLALNATTGGSSNTAVGQLAMQKNISGSGSTGIGRGALLNSVSGGQNVALGYNSLELLTDGHNNTAIGYQAGINLTGSSNTMIGHQAGVNLTSGNLNIYVANVGVGPESSTTRIGNVQTRAFIAGIRGITTGAANGVPVLIDSNGQLGTTSFSRQQGEFSFAGGAAGVNVKTIPFTNSFLGVPKVIVTAKTDDFGGGPVNDTLVASVRSISSTQFQVNVYRIDVAGGGWSANTRLAWMAWE